jgi:hypothetical protein
MPTKGEGKGERLEVESGLARTPTPPRNLLAGQILPRFFRLSVPVLSWLDHALA